ncbi:hypothetical protein YC2023_062038 [Brassica napus]
MHVPMVYLLEAAPSPLDDGITMINTFFSFSYKKGFKPPPSRQQLPTHSCNKCRPHHSHRDKFSVVPLESHHNNNPSFISSPNLIIKFIFQSLTRNSPKP